MPRANGWPRTGRSALSARPALPTGWVPLPVPPRPRLLPTQSAQTCNGLLDELAKIASDEDLATWAHRVLPIKNTLAAAEAQRLEEAFVLKRSGISRADREAIQNESHGDLQPEANKAAAQPLAEGSQENVRPLAVSGRSTDLKRHRSEKHAQAAPRIDKSVLALPEPRRVRDQEHLKFVATQPA